MHNPGSGSAGPGRSQEAVLKKMQAQSQSTNSSTSHPPINQNTPHSSPKATPGDPNAPLLTPLKKSLSFGSQNNWTIGDQKVFDKSVDQCLEMIRDEAGMYETGEAGRDGSLLAAILANTADIFKALGSFEEAKQLLLEAVIIRRKLSTGSSKSAYDLASCLNDYGVLLLDMSLCQEAIECFQEAGEMFSQFAKGALNEGTAATFGNEAVARRYLRDFSAATSAHEKSMELFAETSGRNSESFLNQKSQLAVTLGAAGDSQMAKKVLTEVLSVADKQYPDDYPLVLKLHYELSHIILSN
jgi:tetratricopeptide (TPR) repeat protein